MKRLLLVGVVGLALIGCGESQAEKEAAKNKMTEIKVNRLGKERVMAHLKDGSSAEFKNLVAFCGEVNAKNSFGAFTGFKRYIAPNKSIILIEGDLSPEDFKEAWDRACVSYAK